MAHNGNGGHGPNKLALAVGFGIGITWIALALWSLISAMRGFGDNRPDFGLAWSLVGVLMLAGGGAAIVGTWWHQLRTPSHDH